MNAAAALTHKHPASATRARTPQPLANELAVSTELVEEIRAIRTALAAILAGQNAEFFTRTLLQPQPPAQVQQAVQTPQASASLVGKQFYARVSGKKRLVEVVEETGEARRPYRLRDVKTGRMLHRLRSRAALHEDASKHPFPPKPTPIARHK